MLTEKILKLKNEVLKKSQPQFLLAEEIAEKNSEKVLKAFRELKISDAHFKTTTGYAYGDIAREKLDELFAKIFKAESALVRTQFVSGTHALATVLFGILRPGDEIISVAGSPYDTMQTVIGSLKEFGIDYREIDFVGEKINFAEIKNCVTSKTKIALIQRSRGYSNRPTLKISDIEKICFAVHSANKNCVTFVDNCYGEFVETAEPCEVGADIVAGSLIKNIGGGLAPTGGYIVGRKDLVELASYRLTAPGIGGELGASLSSPRLLFQGLFIAPHIVLQAIKSAIFAAGIFSSLGFKTSPLPTEIRGDIIQAIELKTAKNLIKFCQAIQKFSPVDSFAAPEAWNMPGYEDKIIMAAGTFVQGASIELSADAPLRMPFTVYLQGGLTFEHSIFAICRAAMEF